MQHIVTLITLNPQNALVLQRNLMEHNVDASLEPISLPGSDDIIGVQVKIPLGALPIGMRMIENGLRNGQIKREIRKLGKEGGILIPIDLSETSLNIIKVGFDLARTTGVRPFLLHASIDEKVTNMKKFTDHIKELQREGKLADIDFSTKVVNSIPEEAILDYCKVSQPLCIVMGTHVNRGKAGNPIGSITAEVIYSCRYPILTVPDNYKDFDVEDVKRIGLFCTLDQHDIITVDMLMSMWNCSDRELYLIPANDKLGVGVKNRLSSLVNYLDQSYDSTKFYPYIINNNNFSEEFDNFVKEKKIQLLILPNKKTNVFSRIFKPTLAHRFLFERDMPMLVLPV